ncbi:MAG: sulfatase, partial [Candidatus Aminicenantes bacterium]|nr:sulfatase [Candidatus Aminicenantes bacterium]
VVIMAAALFGSMPGCRKKVSDDNFIFITLDTQRADFISAYSDGKASTPNIDSLAKKGILFENCYSLIPITLPSHASMFFSKPPHEVKNYNNGQIIRPKRNRPSFVSFFQRNGFYTAAFVSLGVMTQKFGLDEGFDLYNDDFPDKRWYLTAEEVNNKVLPWLEESRDKKFFLWVHYSDPHDPYSPPDTPNDFKIFFNEKLLLDACLRKYEYHELNFELKSGKNRLRFEIKNQFVENEDYFRGKMDRMEFFPEANSENLDIDLSRGWLIKRGRNAFFFKNNSIIDITNHKGPMEMSFSFRGSPILTLEAVRSLYKDEVEYMDQEIGNLLEKLNNLGISHKTKIMIIGDHGEGLGEYKNFIGDLHFGHVHYLNDVYMKIPLIIYDPHKPKNALRVKEIATPMDVAPTIFRMMGLKSFQGFRGKDLLHPEKHNETAIFMETHKPEAVMNGFAILQFPWHMIFTPENRSYQLFNLETDPEEKHDLFGNKDLPDEIKILKQRLDEFARDVLKNKEEIKIDKKTEEMLRSLGYIK